MHQYGPGQQPPRQQPPQQYQQQYPPHQFQQPYPWQQPPGYPPPYGNRRQHTAMAYVAAALFLPCVVYTYIAAGIAWDGTTSNVDVLASVLGVALSDDLTGNIDFAISASMTAASTTGTLALVLACRVPAIRWVLTVIGGLVCVYYFYAIVNLVSNDSGGLVGLPVLAFVLWLAPTIVAALPVVGRAMRGARRPTYGHGW